jgi:thiosulfate/3-mercaptopyruvate sulfurtransferase
MGHSTVLVLDGGLPEWAKQGYSVEKEKRDYALGNFEIQTRTVQTKEQILENMNH